MSSQDRAINQVFEGLGLRAGACHPRAYAFFNELAEERRLRRLVKLNLEADNPTGSNFAKMGLQEDTGAESDPAYDSTHREQWFACSILSQVLGDTVYRGQMVLPAVSGRDELAKPPAGTSAQEQGMVVFEHQLSAGFGSEVGP